MRGAARVLRMAWVDVTLAPSSRARSTAENNPVTKPYERNAVERLVPLLRSIARELSERQTLLAQLEAELEHEAEEPRARLLIAEAASQRREIRLVSKEVQRLGCSIVGTEPLTFRIPVRSEPQPHSLVYQVREGDGA